ncbi:MAG: hypothetical protein V2I35_10685 [Desulfocapsaceae bacterium]|jgi:hypothetical protein|nr:hypothetical protein [Desulfocapsaceae bacterium]
MRFKHRSIAVAVACGVLISSTPFSAIATANTPALVSEKNISWKIPYKPLDFVQSVDGSRLFVLTDNSRLLIYEPNGTLKGSIPVDKGVSAIDTDARGENVYLIDSITNTFTSLSVDFVVDIDTTGSPFMGSAEAPVTIAVFTDFE